MRCDQIRSDQIRLGQADQVRSDQVSSGQFRSGKVRSGQVRSGQVTDQIRLGQVRSGHGIPCKPALHSSRSMLEKSGGTWQQSLHCSEDLKGVERRWRMCIWRAMVRARVRRDDARACGPRRFRPRRVHFSRNLLNSLLTASPNERWGCLCAAASSNEAPKWSSA